MHNSFLDLGGALRQLRLQRGWSLDAMARRVGVNKSTLSRWESGKTLPRAHELTSALTALGVPHGAQSLYLEAAGHLPFGTSADAPPLVSGDLLRALRLRRGLTQSEVARAAQVPQGTLSRWERSEDWPTADRLHALCFVLGASVEEAALLTRGRFVPSCLPQAKTDSAAVEILEARKQELITRIQTGDTDSAEFGLLQLEADGWRVARRYGDASPVLLDTMQWQVMFYASHRRWEARLRPVFRRGAMYVRLLKQDNHCLLTTQRIVALQKQGTRCRFEGDAHGLRSVVQGFLSLLPRTSWWFGAEFRAWIYVEAALNLSAMPAPDAVSVQRLLDRAFAEPIHTGAQRSDDPTTLRYAASTYAYLGQTERAIVAAQKAANNDLNRFYSDIVLARITWATGQPEDAAQYLADAEAVAWRLPQHRNLPQLLQDVRHQLHDQGEQNPRRALR